ncbi:HAMP domain-containing histidine kinase [Natronospirillum operosum]|uniref:histidine kinase n=1 Tax=Natronospirillum operosum TaxID=2759953 RepID=A0A4Z0WHT2_9GAMM|nr:HAMP domain-containing sensor histidine kinase [Natronospirillum operosum]TGG95296.1 HAMP domain-containing histidine kinase [Natronospirillum operosum]
MSDFKSALEGIDMKDVLASTVHDVKNSLGMISTQIEEVTLDLRDTNPELADKLSRIQMESSRINVGLSHMLGVYRIDNKLLHPTLDEVLVLDVLEDAAMRYASTLEHQKIRVEIKCEDEDETWVMDSNLVDHVLANIMTNAIRYTRDWIGLTSQVIDNELRITIDDNGDGYPDALINCMDPEASLRMKTSSSGLGIYFASGIAHLHHNPETGKDGRIELVNKPEGGARFTLWLP